MISLRRSLFAIWCFAATGMTTLSLESSSARAQPTACPSWSPRLEDVLGHIPTQIGPDTMEAYSNQKAEILRGGYDSWVQSLGGLQKVLAAFEKSLVGIQDKISALESQGKDATEDRWFAAHREAHLELLRCRASAQRATSIGPAEPPKSEPMSQPNENEPVSSTAAVSAPSDVKLWNERATHPERRGTRGSAKQLEAIKKFAEQGDTDEQLWLGRLYDPDIKDITVLRPENGKLRRYSFSITKSHAEAQRWYEMAANHGGKGAAIPDLKLLKKQATDVKYIVDAVKNAEAWAKAADASGTAEEKALAQKWLDAHRQAQRFDVECRGCASPPTRAEAYAGKSEFYKYQGKEFKAFAQYWDRRWVRADEQETGEHRPTTAEVLAGIAADATGVIAQGRAQRAAIERGQMPGQTLPQQTANGQSNTNGVNNDVDSIANQWRATGLQFSPATITRYADSATAGPFVNLSVTISSPIGGTAGWLLECGEVTNNGLGTAFHEVQTRQGNAWGNFTPSGTRISVDFSPGNSGGDHECRIRVSPKRPAELCCSGRGDNGNGSPMLNSTFHVTVKNIERSGGVR